MKDDLAGKTIGVAAALMMILIIPLAIVLILIFG